MTPDDLSATIAGYGAGLEAEISLLRQLHRLAVQQQDASAQSDCDVHARIAEERRRLMTSLLTIDDQIRPLRELLGAQRVRAAGLSGFAEVVALHRVASALVTSILGADRETLDALQSANLARRVAAQALESGESTMAAYRRVIAPPQSAPALVDRRG